MIVARDQNSVLNVALSDNAIVHKLTKARYSDAEDFLHIVAQDLDQNVRVSVAKNAHTPLEILVQLSGDASAEVRWSVARNPHTPVEILATLAQDNSDVVRSGVASNAETPAFMLEALAEDSSVRVRIAIALNQKTPRLILEGFAQQDLQGAVRIRAANTLAIL